MKNENIYSEMVSKLIKPANEIADQLTVANVHTLHMVVGVSGEAGELLDTIKKSVVYGKPIDMENIIEELGYIEFYIEGLRQGLGISRQQTLEANINKLHKRYHKHCYTNEQAIKRSDKK